MVSADPGSGGQAKPAGSASPPPVGYQTDAPNAYRWTEVAYDYLLNGKLTASIRSASGISTATVTGTCPYCRDDVKFSQVLDVVTGEAMTTLGWRRAEPVKADDNYVPLTVSCACTEPHAGRPEGVTYGCGINFRVEVQPET